MNEDKMVTVCDKCYRVSCWKGIFMCQEADFAETIDLPLWILRKLNLEHPSYWERGERVHHE